MRILKSLNKKYFILIFLFFFIGNSNAEDQPVYICNVDENQIIKNIQNMILPIIDIDRCIINMKEDLYLNLN